MPEQSPLVQEFEIVVPATAGGSDFEVPVGEVDFAGAITSVTYTTHTAITGANTNTRKVEVYNRGSGGAGTQQCALLQFDSGVNTTADDEKAITLVNTAVAAGDILNFKSTHVGSGIADPGGLLRIEITRS